MATEQKKPEETQKPEEKEKEKDKSKKEVLMDEAKETMNKLTSFGKKLLNSAEDRFKMEGQLKAARESLQKFLDPSLKIEEQIPPKLLAGARGIVFLSSIKGGFGIGGSAGTGVIMCKLDYSGGWSGPCSIGLLGGQWGLNIGVQKTDFIIVLRDNSAVKAFTSKGQLKFGADASIAAGPVGRDANVALTVNDKSYAATVSYSMAKGAYIGFAIEGQGIAIRDDCNTAFYGTKFSAAQILGGHMEKEIPSNENYTQICKILDEYTKDVPMKEVKTDK